MAEALAYAKINLTLDILRRREDGYHDMRMVMQSVGLCDRLTIQTGAGCGVRIDSNLSYLPEDRSNIAAKAAEAFFAETGISPVGLAVKLEKHIPVCAGMAGGSSDGAAMLRFLRDTLAPALGQEELERIGALVGSDVPFCLRGGTALAEGRGEVLTDLPPLPECTIVLCKPDFPISTPELFAAVRLRRLRCHPDTAGMREALEARDLIGVARRLYNVFEDVLPRKYRRVFELKRALLDLNALGASMTGSGPTVFGLYADHQRAMEAAQALREQGELVFLSQAVGRIRN